MVQYTSLMIDIKNSRKYSDEGRSFLQRYVKDCIDSLNEVFEPSLAKKVVFSAGDELQGLFHTTQGAILYLNLLEIFLAPIEVRAGIGIGEWSVVIDQGLSTEQDGPVYHNGRAALNYSHKSQINNVGVFFENSKNEFLTSSVNLSSALISRQTDYQNIITMAIELLYPLIYRDEIELASYERLFHLIDKKAELLLVINSDNKGYNKGKLPKIKINRMVVCEPAVISAFGIDVEDVIWRWGTVSNLAELLNKSRQSIEKSIKQGKIIQMRYSKAVSLLMVGKLGG